MSSTAYLEHLASIHLFNSCNQRELTKIARATDEVSIVAGKTLMNQGERGREAFVVVSGEASIQINGNTVATIGPGDHVGELALLDGGTRTATVVANTDMELLVISQRAFFALLDEVPGLSRKILTSMATMVRDLDSRLGALDPSSAHA